MVSVTKSPNMISTTGRRPVMAAPTARPVKPASEMGVSRTRSAPNSSTRPESTLKGVPASATSSPRMQTRESRRISSASASRIASANVSSRAATSGIDVLVGLFRPGIGSGYRKFDGGFNLGCNVGLNLLERGIIRQFLRDHPIGEFADGIALDPLLLL